MFSSAHEQALAELCAEVLRRGPIREAFVRFLVEVVPLLPVIAVERGEDLLTKREVAEMLCCTERTISTYMRRGGLPHEKPGVRPLFRRAVALRWAQDNGKPIAKPRGI